MSVVDTFFRDHTTGTKFKIVRLVNLFWNFPSQIEVPRDPIFLGSGRLINTFIVSLSRSEFTERLRGNSRIKELEISSKVVLQRSLVFLRRFRFGDVQLYVGNLPSKTSNASGFYSKWTEKSVRGPVTFVSSKVVCSFPLALLLDGATMYYVTFQLVCPDLNSKLPDISRLFSFCLLRI